MNTIISRCPQVAYSCSNVDSFPNCRQAIQVWNGPASGSRGDAYSKFVTRRLRSTTRPDRQDQASW